MQQPQFIQKMVSQLPLWFGTRSKELWKKIVNESLVLSQIVYQPRGKNTPPKLQLNYVSLQECQYLDTVV